MASATSPTERLVRCDHWPVMLVLPRAVDTLLGRVVAAAQSVTGERIYKKELLAALVVLKAPDGPDGLAQLFWEYASSSRFGQSPLTLDKVHVTVWLPAPVTHRLDLLVAGARRAKTGALRRDIVAALVTLRCPDTATEAYELYRRYLDCTARDARVRGQPLRSVLSLTRPKPGRRPL